MPGSFLKGMQGKRRTHVKNQTERLEDGKIDVNVINVKCCTNTAPQAARTQPGQRSLLGRMRPSTDGRKTQHRKSGSKTTPRSSPTTRCVGERGTRMLVEKQRPGWGLGEGGLRSGWVLRHVSSSSAACPGLSLSRIDRRPRLRPLLPFHETFNAWKKAVVAFIGTEHDDSADDRMNGTKPLPLESIMQAIGKKDELWRQPYARFEAQGSGDKAIVDVAEWTSRKKGSAHSAMPNSGDKEVQGPDGQWDQPTNFLQAWQAHLTFSV